MRLKTWLSSAVVVVGFAAVVAGCGGSEATPTLSGTAAVGDPLAGATVSVQCAGGIAVQGTVSGANGNWSVDVPGATFPCVVKVTGGTPAVTLYSLAKAAGTVNVTPITNLVFAAAAGSEPSAWASAHAADMPEAVAALASRLAGAVAAVKSSLTRSGFSVPDVDVLNGKFTAVAGDPYDDLLEALKGSLADSGGSYSALVTATAGAGTATVAIPYTRYITAAEVASIPRLNSSSLSVTGDVMTMKTFVTDPSPIGAYVGGGVGNKAIFEIPGLAGTKVADLKSVALELQMVSHEVGNPGYYGNAPYLNFLIDLDCSTAVPANATIAELRARRRHIVYNPDYQSTGRVSSATFVTGEATNTTVAWAMSSAPTLGMKLNASNETLGTLSFDLTAYPNACIVDGASADGGVWRDKTPCWDLPPPRLPNAAAPTRACC